MSLETFLELEAPPSITYNSLHFPSLGCQLGWGRGEIFQKKKTEKITNIILLPLWNDVYWEDITR